MRKVMCAALVVFGLAGWSFAASEADNAVALVKKAAEYIKVNGSEKSVKTLCDSVGGFVQGEMYVFAYDTAGVMLAHPKNAKLIGKNLLDVPDVDGKYFRKEILNIALTKGTGWVDYKYKNPATSKIEEKTTYVQKAGAFVLCCGIYK